MNQPLHGHAFLDRAEPLETVSRKAVFLHGMWRSGSTFVWSRFRESPEACCYYEPLHPGLGRLTRRRIPRDTPELTAANRHPRLNQPYFSEYEPLLAWRGVRGFRRSLVFDRFALEPQAAHEPMRRYLGGLIDHARGLGRTGVLGFNQTSLRIGWLRRTFDSYDIHIERDPMDIWLSYMEHRQRGNFTYFRMWMQVAERNRNHPLFAPIADLLPLRQGAMRMVKPKAYYAGVTESLGTEILYLLVVYMWLACALHALSACDLVIDTGLARRPGYAAGLSAAIREGCGLAVNLDGLRTAPPATTLRLQSADRVEQAALALFPVAALGDLIDPVRVRRRLVELAPRTAALLGRLV